LAATVTTGGAWPSEPGKEMEYAPLGSVIILSAEDDPSDTTVPRLMAANADMSRVHIVSGVRRDGAGRKTFNISSDIDLIEKLALEIGDVRLVSIDPISAYFGGGTDTHNNAEVRGALEPVSDMAARLGIAVVCVSHFSKNAGAGAMNRIIGSQAFVANARAAFMVGTDPDDQSDTRRMFLPIKNNLAPLGKGLTFHLGQLMVGDDILASRVWWDGGTVDCTADEVLSANSGRAEEKSTRAEAEDFLSETLKAGPVLATEVKARATEVGISIATLRRAKSTLKVTWERRAESGNGLGSDGKVYWLMPPGS
jgi:putative DNA primase/helicase